MSAILDIDDVREHVETDLVDEALQRLIDDADSEIIARLGSLTSHTEVLPGGKKHLHLARKASAIVSAVERYWLNDYALGADDYTLLGDGYRVRREIGSTVPYLYWRGIVTIVYTPLDETASRIRLLVDLVKLSVAYSGNTSEQVGDSRIQNREDYQLERENLFKALRTRGRRWLA